MNVTVNQIRQEMTTLVQAHEMVNSFFWGDFHRAYNEQTPLYPLVCSYLTYNTMLDNMSNDNLVIVICDKTYKDYSNLNDTESDCKQVARHLFNVIRQSPRWNALLRLNSATMSKFIDDTSDEVAGVILTLNVNLKSSRSLCDLPLDNYSFDGDFEGNDCEPVLIVNSNQTFTFSAASGTIVELSDTPVLVTDLDGNPLGSGDVPSVTGGTIEVDIQPCLDASFTLVNTDETVLDSGTIPSGGNETITAPDGNVTVLRDGEPFDVVPVASGGTNSIDVPSVPCEPCEDATFQINGDVVGTAESGGMLNIAVTQDGNPVGEFNEDTQEWEVPPCSPVNLEINGVNEGTFAAGSTIEINLTDGTNPVTPDDVTVVGNVVTVELPAGGACPDVGGMPKSGNTVALNPNDEGAIQPGDNPDFLTLNFINPFGNNKRLTGVTGGYADTTYRDAAGTDVGNNLAGRNIAFPNRIVIDWETWRPETKTVWGVYYGSPAKVGGILVDDSPAATYTFADISVALNDMVNAQIGSYINGWMGTTRWWWNNFPSTEQVTDVHGYAPFAGVSSFLIIGGGSWTMSRRGTSGYYVLGRTSGNWLNQVTTGTRPIAGLMRKFTYDPNTNTLI